MTTVVIGGTKGIGRAIAARFAQSGELVVINGHSDRTAADETVRLIAERGGRAELVWGDISTPAGADAIFQAVSRYTDRIDALVHCAVHPAAGSLLDMEIDDFHASIAVGGLSVLYMARAAAPMLGPGSSLVFISSSGAQKVVPRYGAIGTAKAAAEALVRYLAVELAPRGVGVNTVSSGPVGTDAYYSVFPDAEERLNRAAEQSPAHRAQTVDDAANLVFAVCSSDMEMVQGQHIRVDGGLYL